AINGQYWPRLYVGVPMSKFVSCHAKYFKRSQVAGLHGHHTRQFEHDANVYPEFTPFNFTTKLTKTFKELESEMVNAKRIAGKKSSNLHFRNDANVLIDNVLIFSREQLDFLRIKAPEHWRGLLEKCGRDLALGIQREFGLLPMDIHWHFDEGHYDEYGSFKHNYHAHMTFFNFDFKTLEQPLRKMKRADFSKIQDLAAKSFGHLGFERGLKKSVTGKSHKEKAVFLADSLKVLESEKKELELKVQELQKVYDDALTGAARMEIKFQHAVAKLKSVQGELDELTSQLTTLKQSSDPREYAQIKKIERLERENAEFRQLLGLNAVEVMGSSDEPTPLPTQNKP
ncbi:recombinase, partial [Vibrio paracholerae]|uniref:recombinase n=2 Tax=Vibrionaceae TaxID=641 RepID=UPI001F2479FE